MGLEEYVRKKYSLYVSNSVNDFICSACELGYSRT